MTKNNLVLGVTLIVLVVTLPLVLLVTRGRIDLRPRAEFGNANLSFSFESADITYDRDKEIKLIIDTGDKLLSGVDISLLYDSNILEIVEITPSTYFDTHLLIEKQIPTDTDPYAAMQLILVRKTSTMELKSGEQEIATVKVRGKQLDRKSVV